MLVHQKVLDGKNNMGKKHLAPLHLLPAKKGVCTECAIDHEKEAPHNRDSLFYQYYFFNQNGRWPTWKDAMEHCDHEMRAKWCEALIKRGVEIE